MARATTRNSLDSSNGILPLEPLQLSAEKPDKEVCFEYTVSSKSNVSVQENELTPFPDRMLPSPSPENPMIFSSENHFSPAHSPFEKRTLGFPPARFIASAPDVSASIVGTILALGLSLYGYNLHQLHLLGPGYIR